MKNLFCFTLVLCCTFGFGQDHWINYTSNNKIFDIEVTDDGIWLGSEGGLGFFNTITGDEEYFNSGNSMIPSNRVVDILYQEDDDLWATTWQGICKINKSEMTVGPAITGPMRENLDGKIVVAGTDNLHIQDEGMDFVAIPYPAYSVEINGLEVDEKTGAIYVNVINYFSESYLASWLDGEWTILLDGYFIETAMTLDRENRIWFYSRDGLQFLEEDVWNLIPGTAVEGSNFIPKLYVNNENEIVIEYVHYQDCLELKVWDGTKLVDLNYTDGDCADYYFIGPAASESDLYYASHNTKGLFRFRSDQIFGFMQLTQSPLIYNFVLNTLHPDDGSHIVVYSDRIHKINAGNSWAEIAVPDDLNGNIQKGFLDEEGDLWIFTADYLWELKDGEWAQLPLPAEINDNISLMAVGENGDIWIQSKLNLARYRDSEWNVYKTLHHGITSTIFRDMEVDPENGDLWVSSFEGVIQFDGTTWLIYDTEPTSQFFNIVLGRGGAFAIKNSQLYFLRDGVSESIPFPIEGEHNGFFSDVAYDASNDRIYLSGVLSLAILENEEWTTYTAANSGLYSSGNNDMRVDNDENLWLSGSGGGLCIFNLEGITTLSVSEEGLEEDLVSSVKVYPTLVTEDYFFVESEKSGRYQVLVSDLAGRVIYNREHLLIQGVPSQVNLTVDVDDIIFATIENGNMMMTKKMFRMIR